MLFTFNLCLMSTCKMVKYITGYISCTRMVLVGTPFFVITPLRVKFVAFSYINIIVYIMIYYLCLSFFVVITKDSFLLLNLIL